MTNYTQLALDAIANNEPTGINDPWGNPIGHRAMLGEHLCEAIGHYEGIGGVAMSVCLDADQKDTVDQAGSKMFALFTKEFWEYVEQLAAKLEAEQQAIDDRPQGDIEAFKMAREMEDLG